MIKVYNPGDDGEPSSFGYNGHAFLLAPNSDTEIVLPTDEAGKILPGWEKIPLKAVVGACLMQLADVGVVLLSGDDIADAVLREGAEARYEAHLRARYVPILKRWADKLRDFVAAGAIPPEEPPDVTFAKKRLKDWQLLTALVLALLWAPLAAAQSASFTYSRTLASGTRTYCKTFGALGNPFGGPIAGLGRLTTSGASTTVNSDNTAAFVNMATPSATKGAVIFVSVDSGTTYTPYRVASKTDNDTVVIDTSVNWAAPGNVWSWIDETCGTTDADGWIDSNPGDSVTAMYVGGSATATVTVECRQSGVGALPVQVYPDNSAGAASRSLTAADINNRFIWALTPDLKCTGLRLGFAGTNPIVTGFISRIK